jgi:WhiB family redox-sensing transcriptional regulator
VSGHFAEVTAPLPLAALSWQRQALCAEVDPEAFYVEKGGSTREARRVCAACPVRGECLGYALAMGERYGIWGGLTYRERLAVRGDAA